MKIDYSGKRPKYFDNNGKEIHDHDWVMMNGHKERVYLTVDGELGTDATNPKWVESGRAVPCEYGVYPFNSRDDVYLVEENNDFSNKMGLDTRTDEARE